MPLVSMPAPTTGFGPSGSSFRGNEQTDRAKFILEELQRRGYDEIPDVLLREILAYSYDVQVPRVQHREDFAISGVLNGLSNIGQETGSKINPLFIGVAAALLAFMLLGKGSSKDGSVNSKLYGTYVLAGVTTMAVAKMMQ